MEPKADRHYTAFAHTKKIASGEVMDVVLKVKKFLKNDVKSQVLIFDSETSQQIEIDFRGTAETAVRRLESLLAKNESAQEGPAKSGPGRPRLGVTAKEVTLLPGHWEWLARQPGGASVTLRKLVEEAKKKNQAKDLILQSQESTYKFMTAMAGDLPYYEEALRALYAGDAKSFEKRVGEWPKDISEHVSRLAKLSWGKF